MSFSGIASHAGRHRRLHHGAIMRQPDPKGYDTDALRAFLKQQKIPPIIPAKSNRKKRIRRARKAYKNRNVIERCFGRLKDFRRIATRYG